MSRIIFSEKETYAGWPANHGLWQWGNEIIVGFIHGKYNVGGMHNVVGELKFSQLRSLDYGQTWEFEETIIKERLGDLIEYTPHEGDIFRIRGSYDHGGDYLKRRGGFFASNDRGKTWRGPFDFKGLDLDKGEHENSSRTCIADGIFYLTMRNIRDWASDFVTPAVFKDGKFEFINEMALKADHRRAMPSVAVLNGVTCMAVRTKCGLSPEGIEIYKWDNGWHYTHSVDTGNSNGNPPSMICKNNVLYCLYGNRKTRYLRCVSTKDLKNWDEREIHRSRTSDFGYCRSFDAGDLGIGTIFYEDNGEDRSELKACFIDA